MPGRRAESSPLARSGASRVSAGLGSGVGVSQTLPARICGAAVTLVGEVGYARMSVERVVRVAGISREMFYKCFQDLDDCLLAAFEDAIGRIADVVGRAYEGEREWPAKVGAALAALLEFVEGEPALSMFVFVGALGAGPKVLASRMQALERLNLAFEHGIDGAGRVDGNGIAGNGIDEMGSVADSEIGESSPLREIREFSPLSAEGAVNGVLGILHTRLLEGSPLARRPLSELAGPLTAMIVLPYLGRALAARELATGRSSSSGRSQRRAGSKAQAKAGARKPKRARLSPRQRAILETLEDGPRTVLEVVVITGLSDQAARNNFNGLERRKKVVKTERDGKIAYALPSKGRATAGRDAAVKSSPPPESSQAPTAVRAAPNGAGTSASNGAGTSNGTGALAAPSASNGAGSAISNGAGASNGHDRFVPAKAILQGLDTPISAREFMLISAIDELNAGGSSPSNREIGNATQIHDPTHLSKLTEHLAHLWLVQNTTTGRPAGKPHAWRLTAKGTELLRKLEGQTVGA
jgi:AcrR family transcriptional regulator